MAEKPQTTTQPAATEGDKEKEEAIRRQAAAQRAVDNDSRRETSVFYRVQHAGVGNWRQGDVIEGGSLDSESLTRLLSLGALKRTKEANSDEDEFDE